MTNKELDNLFISVVRKSDINSMKYLLDKGANINAQTIDCQWTALHFACQSGSIECLEFLYNKGIDMQKITKSGNTALEIAIANDRLEMVKFLIAKVPSIIDEIDHEYSLMAKDMGFPVIADYLKNILQAKHEQTALDMLINTAETTQEIVF